MSKKLIIIGAGASGLIASIFAKKAGLDVLIVEKLSSIGKKILATGNGRCNLSNEDLDYDHFHSQNSDFFKTALEKFDFDKTVEFFSQIGVETVTKNGTKIYPMSLQASSVVELLKYEIEELGIEVKLNCLVRSIRKSDNKFSVELENQTLKADKILIATGGKVASHLGSSGDGYEFAKSFGHTITDIFPSLIQLKSDENYLKIVDGVKFDGVVNLFIDNKLINSKEGDILFTKYGISGNSILDISRESSEALFYNKEVAVELNLLPKLSSQDIHSILLKRFELKPKKLLSFSLIGLINKKLIKPLLEITQIEDRNVANISKKERNKIVNTLQNWRIKITDTQEFKRAETTAGGVCVDEVNPNTMESKIIKGVYFAGEVLDVDGDCGGYNLQWAWSSGYLAGRE